MGFFDALGTVFERVVPTAIGFATGGPIGAATALSGVERAKRTKKNLERQEFMFQTDRGFLPVRDNVAVPSYTGNHTSFFGDLGSTIGNFGRDVGGFVQDIAPALNLFGVGGGSQRTNSGVAQTIIRQAPDESSTSGELLGANLGMGANLIQAATRFARSPAGGSVLGFGAGAIGAAMGGGQNGAPRITRRMKSDVRRIYNMSMGNPDITAQILNQMGTYPKIDFDATTMFFILTRS